MIELLPEWSSPAQPSAAAPAWRPTLGDFSAALAAAGILDNRVVDLPGAVVAMPYGVDLLNRFRARIHAIFRDGGLEEHEYPLLAPRSALRPVEELLDLDGRLLYAGGEADFSAGRPDVALLPTGEAAVYTHWARTVHRPGDLPIRAYRRARYFRPVSRGRHAGRGVFYAMEHDDIFELHCAYGSEDEQRDGLRRYRAVLEAAVGALHVPALWSTRPPWTNRHEIAEWAVAADVPLPIQATTQVSSLYNQGTRFARAFGIAVREHGETRHAVQLSGYVSRRLLLVHLLLGLRPSGDFFLHPDVAPVQVAVLLRPARESDEGAARAIVARLTDAGILARLSVLAPRARAGRERAVWAARGAPLILTLSGAREPGEPLGIALRRSDLEAETTLEPDVSALVRTCAAALEEIGAAYRRHVEESAASRVVQVADRDAARAALAERMVAVCPLAEEAATVTEVGTWRMGEVLGFRRVSEPRPCVLTGRPAGTVAFVSPRV